MLNYSNLNIYHPIKQNKLEFKLATLYYIWPAHDLFHLGGQARDEGHGPAQEQEDDDEGSVGEYLLQGVKVRDPANDKQAFSPIP